MKLLLSVSAIALVTAFGGTAAYAADLMVDSVAIEAATPDSTWEGAYVGGHVGYSVGTVNWDSGATGEYDIAGWTVGGQLGYNWQVDSIVFGLEGDLSLSDISGDDPAIFASRQVNWLGSARGRVGFALDSVLLYGTAGLAFANSTGEFFIADDTQTHLGWTVGIGAEAMVSDNVSVKAEYRYTDYGAETYDYTFLQSDTGFVTHTIEGGVNFHF